MVVFKLNRQPVRKVKASNGGYVGILLYLLFYTLQYHVKI